MTRAQPPPSDLAYRGSCAAASNSRCPTAQLTQWALCACTRVRIDHAGVNRRDGIYNRGLVPSTTGTSRASSSGRKGSRLADGCAGALLHIAAHASAPLASVLSGAGVSLESCAPRERKAVLHDRRSAGVWCMCLILLPVHCLWEVGMCGITLDTAEVQLQHRLAQCGDLAHCRSCNTHIRSYRLAHHLCQPLPPAQQSGSNSSAPHIIVAARRRVHHAPCLPAAARSLFWQSSHYDPHGSTAALIRLAGRVAARLEAVWPSPASVAPRRCSAATASALPQP